MSSAKASAEKLKELTTREPIIDPDSTTGKMVTSTDLKGQISLENITFTYPSRPHQQVLRGISLTASRGQYIALVGASGSGKSTVVSLLERFYDVDSGSIAIDGIDIREYNVSSYRRHIALVSQETMLFSGSIRENILSDRSAEEVGQEEIENAAKDANIHDFITSLPQGYDTPVGPKATLLSGGQRQRLSLARALLRNPSILLLDEATSALDSSSEAVVQEALDRARLGRTTIAIAHRLSTVRKADCIYVFEAGRIVERGPHEELVEKRGVYWGLVKGQEGR
jgi:ATP-binding cassette, subfamily B (MDR/TAP), member 1